MPINKLYHTWFHQIRELHPSLRVTQVRSFSWLLYGLYQSRSVYLSRAAMKIPGQAKLLSTVRRLSRILDNPAIRVREFYEPIAVQWLTEQLKKLGEIHLIVDGTKIGFGHQLLMVSLAYRKRAIPIAWTWVKHVRGHSTGHKQLALFAYVKSIIPPKAPVFLVGDTEFGSIKVLKTLDQWQWFYVLRQASDTSVWSKIKKEWQPFGSLVQKAGQSVWLVTREFSRSHIYPVNLLAHWEKGEKEPWLLATNLPDPKLALRFYKRRVWIEEMFGDFKKHGFDLEVSMLHNFLRLSRLTLAVAFLYVWLISSGTKTVHRGLRHLVDRNERRDLSIFQIGLRYIERCIVNGKPFTISTCSYR